MKDHICVGLNRTFSGWLVTIIVCFAVVLLLTACNSNNDHNSSNGNPGDGEIVNETPDNGMPAAITLQGNIPGQLIKNTANCLDSNGLVLATVNVYAGNIHYPVEDARVTFIQSLPVTASETGQFHYEVSFANSNNSSYFLSLTCGTNNMLLSHDVQAKHKLMNVFVSQNPDGLQLGDLVLPAKHINTDASCAECHVLNDSLQVTLLDFSGESIDLCNTCHDGSVALGQSEGHVSTDMSCLECHNALSWQIDTLDHQHVSYMTCIECHNNQAAQGKPATHIATDSICNACHAPGTAPWAPLSQPVDHGHVFGSCTSCHCNIIAALGNCGLGLVHPLVQQECGDCHSTNLWLPLAVDHSVLTDACVTCHDGVSASGKGNSHIETTDHCDACHEPAPATWAPVLSANVNHDEVVGSCASCHVCVIGPCNMLPAGHSDYVDDCGACHSSAGWLPLVVDHVLTTTQCITCHDGTNASGKSRSHINTTEVCEACHNPVPATWIPVAPADVDHNEVIGTCASCHAICIIECNFSFSHRDYVDSCGACHSTMTWLPLEVDHSLTTAQCVACHNNAIESGKFASHPDTSDVCEACHKPPPESWLVFFTVDHNEVNGECINCHNCVIEGPSCLKTPDDHFRYTFECGACHSTANWRPVQTFNHGAVIGNCSDCHDGIVARGKSDTHIVTTLECNVCHTTESWTPN